MTTPVQMLWIGKRLPRLCYKCMASFSGLHPVHLYTYVAPTEYPDNVTLMPAADILPESQIFTYKKGFGAGSYAAFANLFRYKLLYDRGGWWLDTDVYCLQSLGPLDAYEHVYTYEPNSTSVFHNGAIKAAKGSAAMAALYAAARYRDPYDLNWGDTGGRLMVTHKNTLLRQPHTILPSAAFCPLHWRDIDKYVLGKKPLPELSSAYAVHLFQQMWKKRRLITDDDYPIYGALKCKTLIN